VLRDLEAMQKALRVGNRKRRNTAALAGQTL
jgi:hypothetical protein